MQLYGYKHESKRNAYDSVRLHNLIFLLYHFIKCLDKSLPRFNSDNVIRCSYFVNIIYYLPLVFELHNTISFNAGPNEDMFRQIKSIAQNFTNHQHATPQLLLNVQRRLECNRYYHGNNFETRSSEFSKKSTYFFINSPPPPISYSKEFIENSEDFPFLLQRLSTFLVSNNGDRYVSSVQKQLIVFNYKSCSCASSDCSICLGKNFPAFGINNILSSSISKILKVKESVYENQVKVFVFTSNNKLVFKKLIELVSGQIAVNLVEPLVKVSDQIICRTTIDTINDAQVKLPSSFKNILKHLPDIKHKDYQKLRNSFQVQCLAKIYGTVDKDLIIFDRVAGSVESIQKQFKNNPSALKNSETFFNAKRTYITHTRKHIHRLNEFVTHLSNEIQTVSSKIDNTIYTVLNEEPDDDLSGEVRSSESKIIIENLANLQKRLLAYRYAVQTLHSESNSHPYIMTEFDEGLL